MMDREQTGMLEQLLAEVDARPTMASYHEAARRLDSGPDMLKPVRIALLASFTIEPVVPFLRVEAARHGFRGDIYIGPYNSIDQELLWSDSGCARHMPDVVFISYTLADACPRLCDDFLSLPCATVDRIVEEVVGRIVSAVAAFRARSTAPVVVTNFVASRSAPHGVYEPMVERSQTDAIQRLNARLARRLKSIDGAYVLDFHAIASDVGRRHWFDAKLWHLARAPLSAAGLAAVAKRQAIFLRALLTPPRKCLVLDLDNTLWGGVLGEAGPGGIKLGATYPGSVYREFQGVIRQLQRRGVLLAINSKNNQSEADEVLAGHPDMVLRPEDFAAVRINWDPKPENMIAIAQELNIGLDAMVFFDDSPAECSLMREALPDVLTVQAPADPMEFSAALLDTGAFERLSQTAEDAHRGRMYREQAGRRAAALGAGSIDEFLRGLQMVADIQPVDDFAFTRVVDLIQKTNQFNLTTRRYSAAELRAILEDVGREAFYLRLTDRFGDNGIVGVAVLDYRGAVAAIDTLLLSCRVIGRSAETALLAFLVKRAQARGKERIEGLFTPTAKNAPARDFFSRHGFERISEDASGTRWRLAIANATIEWPSSIAAAAETLANGHR